MPEQEKKSEADDSFLNEAYNVWLQASQLGEDRSDGTEGEEEEGGGPEDEHPSASAFLKLSQGLARYYERCLLRDFVALRNATSRPRLKPLVMAHVAGRLGFWARVTEAGVEVRQSQDTNSPQHETGSNLHILVLPVPGFIQWLEDPGMYDFLLEALTGSEKQDGFKVHHIDYGSNLDNIQLKVHTRTGVITIGKRYRAESFGSTLVAKSPWGFLHF